MIGKKPFLLFLLGAFLLGGCSYRKTVVVLLPDPDGHAGEIDITNKHGSKPINQAGYAVSERNNNAPQPPVMISEEEMRQIFVNALTDKSSV